MVTLDIRAFQFEQSLLMQVFRFPSHIFPDLLTPNNFHKVVEHRTQNRKRTFDFRNLTYIPELSDKKHRTSYNYLSAGYYFSYSLTDFVNLFHGNI